MSILGTSGPTIGTRLEPRGKRKMISEREEKWVSDDDEQDTMKNQRGGWEHGRDDLMAVNETKETREKTCHFREREVRA